MSPINWHYNSPESDLPFKDIQCVLYKTEASLLSPTGTCNIGFHLLLKNQLTKVANHSKVVTPTMVGGGNSVVSKVKTREIQKVTEL